MKQESRGIELRLDDLGFILRRRPSIYTTRNNSRFQKEDLRILKRNPDAWGERDARSGRFYETHAVYAVESGELLSGDPRLPDGMSFDTLVYAGLLDRAPGEHAAEAPDRQEDAQAHAGARP